MKKCDSCSNVITGHQTICNICLTGIARFKLRSKLDLNYTASIYPLIEKRTFEINDKEVGISHLKDLAQIKKRYPCHYFIKAIDIDNNETNYYAYHLSMVSVNNAYSEIYALFKISEFTSRFEITVE